MSATTMDFTPEGLIRCLYTDRIPLQTLGKLTVKRASMVAFNEQTQEWEVLGFIEGAIGECDPGGWDGKPPLFKSQSRTECLDWESEHWQEFV